MKKVVFRLKDFFTKKAEKQEFSYFVIGACTAGLSLLILYLLTDIAGLHYLVSAIVAAVFCSTINFMLNKTVTFHEKFGRRFVREYFGFGGVTLAGGVFQFISLFLLTSIFGLYYIISSVISIFIAGSFRFVGNKLFIFRK